MYVYYKQREQIGSKTKTHLIKRQKNYSLDNKTVKQHRKFLKENLCRFRVIFHVYYQIIDIA